ncbi:MAG TPA: bacterial transcriptional activator domain-containing protein, partial [Gemmatimonadales bacterium]|nr:bacterial transcriptional activator domain-containing protein [Gemmatimonadales bacterium]
WSVAVVSPAGAQAGHDHAAPHAEKLGRVTFATSCQPAVQADFERAVALLHSFWWEESGVAFRAVAEADPGCLMAYWGQAMTLRNNPFAGAPAPGNLPQARAVLERAATVSGGTPRERAYLGAIAAFFRDYATVPHAQRAAAYEVAMKAVAEQYADDLEATIFYALSVASNASTTDTSFTRQREVGRLLEPLLEQQPEHPGLAHYVIHTYDSPRLASLGVQAARRYAEIAPAAYHAHHMPSHIFVRLGMWDETVQSNRNSADASLELERKEGYAGIHNHRLHAYDYMVYGYLQRGQDAAARAIVAETQGVTTVIPPDQVVSDYSQASIPARYALERSAWREAAALPVRKTKGFTPAEAITHFARGLGAARSGDPAAARADAAALLAIETGMPATQAYWARLVKAQRLSVEGWIAQAEGRREEAVRLASEAASLEDGTDKHPVTPGHVLPAREVLADLLLEQGRHAEARRAYDAVLGKEPHRARAVFGAARAAELAGDRAAAQSRYQEYLQLMDKADTERPEVAQARRTARGN